MKNFQEKVQSGFWLLKNKLSASIEKILHSNKQKVHDILQSDENKNTADQRVDSQKLWESVETSKKLQPYSIEFLWEKIIVLWYQNSNEIYKIFPANGWDFIHGNQAEQITALFQTHRRAFFKKVKNNSKNTNAIRKIFSEIGKKNIPTIQEEKPAVTIEPKKSAAQRIQENKRKKNLEAIEKRKQKKAKQIEAQKQKQIEKQQKVHAENISTDYETLEGFTGHMSKISSWQNDMTKVLSAQEKQEKFQQISAASSIYKILMTRLPKDIFTKYIWLDDTKRYTVIKEEIKKYLHQDFQYSLEVKNQQRHILHLVNSACEILLLSKQYQKQNQQNPQWTQYYKNAA